jgi:hypothetical protein
MEKQIIYNAETDIPKANQLLEQCINSRQNAYLTELGNWQNQLDMIYHDFDGWKAAVKAIKDKYPKDNT